MLFHETGIATNPNMEESMHMYSCASCHHAKAGFQSGILQGIGEGGNGFGINGEGRFKNALYAESDLDVQPIRTPSALKRGLPRCDVMERSIWRYRNKSRHRGKLDSRNT